MKKYWLTLSFLAFFSSGLIAQNNTIKKDLQIYQTNFKNLIVLENEALDMLKPEHIKQYTPDSTISKQIKEFLIPKYNEFAKKMKSLKISTPEVKDLHQAYLEIIESNLKGFSLLLKGFEKKDDASFRKANNDFNVGKTLRAEWQKNYAQLCKDNALSTK